MNKIKKIVLSVLLLTFTFITVHDYVVVNQNTAQMLVSNECDNTLVDVASHVHDSIHTLLSHITQNTNSITLVSQYQKQPEIKDFFVSQIVSVPQRPPLS